MKSVLKFFAAALILSLALAALAERPGRVEAEWLGYRAATSLAFLLPLLLFWSWLMIRIGRILAARQRSRSSSAGRAPHS